MIEKVLIGVALPACIALVVLLISWKPWRRSSLPRNGHFGVPIAIGFAFLLSFVAEAGLPVLESAEGWQWKLDRWEWIAPLVLVAIVLGVIASMVQRNAWIHLFLIILVGMTTSWWLKLPTLDAMVARVTLGALVVGYFLLVNPIAQRRSGVLLPIVFWLIFATASGVVLQSGFAKLAIICGALSASCGMAMLVAMMNHRFSFERSGMVILSLLVPIIMACGYAYDDTELNILCFLLPAIAPFFLWFGELSAVKKLQPWQAITVRLVLVMIPCAISIALVILAGMNEAANDMNSYY